MGYWLNTRRRKKKYCDNNIRFKIWWDKAVESFENIFFKIKTFLRTVRIKDGKVPEGYGAQKSRRLSTFFCHH